MEPLFLSSHSRGEVVLGVDVAVHPIRWGGCSGSTPVGRTRNTRDQSILHFVPFPRPAWP